MRTSTFIDEVTVHVARSRGRGRIPVTGRLVIPGLAITPCIDNPTTRYVITHIRSGLALIPNRCAVHIEDAARLVAAIPTPIDWAAEFDKDRDREEALALAEKVREVIGVCSRSRCDLPPGTRSYDARCNTCGWTALDGIDEESDAWPLTAMAAARAASRHDCEPDVQVFNPGNGAGVDGEWLREYPPRVLGEPTVTPVPAAED